MSTFSEWPSLPTKGFLSGRPAQEKDVEDGNAVFVARVGDAIIGKPLAITIPQFAFWTDGNGKKVPVVIIQAEEANGIHIFGFRDIAGVDHAATGPEIELLGAAPPN